ncbi:MAG: heat-inducible transcriptional repressor HrcA [bacterium]
MVLIELDDRKQKILQAVIHHYISGGKPVGSHVLTGRYNLDLSSATIRNIMAELEKMGYLTHPHTSAGRVPTDAGYRFYVDRLVHIQKLAYEQTRLIQKEYEAHRRQVEKIMQQTSRMLSLLSNYTGFVLPPLLKVTSFKRIELIFLERKKFLALLITDADLVKHKIIELPEEVSPDILHRASRFYNDELTGLTLGEIKRFISGELNKTRIPEIKLLNFILKITKKVFDFGDEESIYLEGTGNIFSHPDFGDYEKIRSVFEIIEERETFSRLLYDRIKDNGVKVLIGRENPCEQMQECSLVTSTYKAGANAVGVLGIIGPKRMEYPKMIALVNFISKLVNEVLNKK